MEVEYPRFLTTELRPFDPLKLYIETEKIVCKNNSRKYTDFYCAGVYGGISTGYLVGCSLRCVFCWVNWSRDFPEKFGEFYTAEQVFQRLVNKAKKKKVSKLRVSGGEPTIGKKHLLNLLDLVNTTDYLFILETNGILLGQDKDFVKELKGYKNIHVRISIKAGTSEGFQSRTGAKGEFFKLPFQAIKYLKEANISFHVACMSDSKLMPRAERKNIVNRLYEIGYKEYFEEESCDPYKTSLARLEKAGFNIFK